MQKLERLTERIWYYSFETERDRPNLGYIRGDRRIVAVDAGHSETHTRAFYAALEEAGLPLPDLTVMTHWHWDHTFGMHAVHGLCAANKRTDGHLRQFREQIRREGTDCFFSIHESIRREYAGNRPVIITPADLVFEGPLTLDAGNCTVRVLLTEAPHTDDSTLVHICGEKVLFLGDACCEPCTGGERDPEKAGALAETIAGTGAEICLEGHWTPLGREETIRDLLGGGN